MRSTRPARAGRYRDTNAKEIDLVLEADSKLHPLEVKTLASLALRATPAF